MLDEKRIQQIEGRVRNFLSDGTIQKTKKIEYVDFFLENARKSLQAFCMPARQRKRCRKLMALKALTALCG